MSKREKSTGSIYKAWSRWDRRQSKISEKLLKQVRNSKNDQDAEKHRKRLVTHELRKPLSVPGSSEQYLRDLAEEEMSVSSVIDEGMEIELAKK